MCGRAEKVITIPNFYLDLHKFNRERKPQFFQVCPEFFSVRGPIITQGIVLTTLHTKSSVKLRILIITNKNKETSQESPFKYTALSMIKRVNKN